MEERFKNDVEDFQNAESRIMGEFKGTKGEWFISPYDRMLTSVISTEKNARGHETICWMNSKSDYHDECNAQLIAAAPKLLVELYQITLLLKALPENNSEMRERIESAEKAINKALGL